MKYKQKGLDVYCQYCNKQAQFVDSRIIFGKSYGMIYYCADCQAWVGVHCGTCNPLGVLANEELRLAKRSAHLYFDTIWQTRRMPRHVAYPWLAQKLNKDVSKTHIGEFSVKECELVVEICKQYLFK